ncbi:hypothetical protein L3X38_024665 [Prunus dulcis]|uniref:Uncharacterized protein n=1 Tax=Prunus dulcis TaxID=3755 RepID=A0AAD4W2Z2_PRUDU|nr:hypothetical protein L3X38_024665 [Prunus dulcis]
MSVNYQSVRKSDKEKEETYRSPESEGMTTFLPNEPLPKQARVTGSVRPSSSSAVKMALCLLDFRTLLGADLASSSTKLAVYQLPLKRPTPRPNGSGRPVALAVPPKFGSPDRLMSALEPPPFEPKSRPVDAIVSWP